MTGFLWHVNLFFFFIKIPTDGSFVNRLDFFEKRVLTNNGAAFYDYSQHNKILLLSRVG